MIPDQLYEVTDLSELSVYCVFTRLVRELPCPSLQRSDTVSVGRWYLCSALEGIFGTNRFSKLHQISCQERSPYKCCHL